MICMNIFMYPNCTASFGSLSVDVEGSASLSVLPPLHCFSSHNNPSPHPALYMSTDPLFMFHLFRPISYTQCFLHPLDYFLFLSYPFITTLSITGTHFHIISCLPLSLCQVPAHTICFCHSVTPTSQTRPLSPVISAHPFLLPSFAGWTVPQLSGLGFHPL